MAARGVSVLSNSQKFPFSDFFKEFVKLKWKNGNFRRCACSEASPSTTPAVFGASPPTTPAVCSDSSFGPLEILSGSKVSI